MRFRLSSWLLDRFSSSKRGSAFRYAALEGDRESTWNCSRHHCVHSIKEHYLRASRFAASSVLRGRNFHIINLASLLSDGDTFVALARTQRIYPLLLHGFIAFCRIPASMRSRPIPTPSSGYPWIPMRSRHGPECGAFRSQRALEFVFGAVSYVFTTVENPPSGSLVDAPVSVPCRRLMKWTSRAIPRGENLCRGTGKTGAQRRPWPIPGRSNQGRVSQRYKDKGIEDLLRGHGFFLLDGKTTNSELAAVCDRLAKHPVITVDTEFLRETTYYPLLCVVQMASAGGSGRR